MGYTLKFPYIGFANFKLLLLFLEVLALFLCKRQIQKLQGGPIQGGEIQFYEGTDAKISCGFINIYMFL